MQLNLPIFNQNTFADGEKGMAFFNKGKTV